MRGHLSERVGVYCFLWWMASRGWCLNFMEMIAEWKS